MQLNQFRSPTIGDDQAGLGAGAAPRLRSPELPHHWRRPNPPSSQTPLPLALLTSNSFSLWNSNVYAEQRTIELTVTFSFVDFVDKLLNETLRDGPSVEKIVFLCGDGYGNDKIISWVCAALWLNVVHLHLKYNMNDSKALFHSLNGCKTLVKLQLGKYFQGFDKCTGGYMAFESLLTTSPICLKECCIDISPDGAQTSGVWN
ncbi:hypothetical protein RD792_000290 [Penstemon davidsonii]|uniref:Uncharacterized protein n=1 Tax=Penstemon davidsonii TaxID=160366 RepID=A0ABR0DUP7_9LAMI|nr:hypothetical protein RD792_000290 [Penstemon davidsonii]